MKRIMRRGWMVLGLAMVLVLGLATAGCGDDDEMMPDAAVDAGGCFACGPSQVCVQKFTGCRSSGATCVNSSLTCPANTCAAACEAEICGRVDGGVGGASCQNRIQCGGEVLNAFTCYGP